MQNNPSAVMPLNVRTLPFVAARIRCQLSGCSPRKEDEWFCTCGCEWNAFDTGGVCPVCLHPGTEPMTHVTNLETDVDAIGYAAYLVAGVFADGKVAERGRK